MNEKLSLNASSDCYEASFTIKVEAEIFQRAFFKYVEEHHIDITNPDAWQEAVRQVAKIERWIDHPRTQKVYCAAPFTPSPLSPPPITNREPTPKLVIDVPVPLLPEPDEPEPVEPEPEPEPEHAEQTEHEESGPRKIPSYGPLKDEEKKELRERALSLPVDRWEIELLWTLEGLPPGKNPQRHRVHQRRYFEKKVLEQLKEELEPISGERLVAIAGAVNGTRLR